MQDDNEGADVYESTRPCAGCERPIDAAFAHCNHCGTAQFTPQAQAVASTAQGIAIAVKTRDIHITQGRGWDNRPTANHEKHGTRFVSRGLEVAANLATVIGLAVTFGGILIAPNGDGKLIVVGIVAALTVGAALIAVPLLTARMNGWTVVRLGSLVLGVVRKREDNHRLEWIDARLKCPQCPAGSSRGIMTLQHFDNETWWVCTANRKRHQYVFDGTQYVD
ncbi:hypothetical protein LXM50_14850 [Microbacterium sp. Au-Mic1]|uniref:hypothetical protein n=1 Tax=Microbacterium sp. Au-Mic1 TaxID=2906457 RepID=UPI001E613B4D|nr:hypothetical protein [Microbacterium sp. Au-Mic1]MCE4027251.1 hypothetical protein [Microbacterium sp. Au-Mic1]